MRRRRAEQRVLLVEDDGPLRELVRVAVSEAGYVVEVAEDAATALRMLENHGAEFAAVILDLALPDLPGRFVLARAKQIRADLPIIVATGSDDSCDGADLRINKPYGPHDVVGALDALTLGVVAGDLRPRPATPA